VEAANNFYPKTGLWQQPAHQTAVRASVKLSLATAIAIRLADAIGVDKYLHVQQMLGELVTTLETVKGLISAAEHDYEITPSGEARPAAHPLEAIRGIMPTAYARAIEVIQTIGAGGLLVMPTAKDYNHPELKKDFDRYFGGRAGISAEERIALFKLAWDLCGEAFGQRLVQYERYYAGDPVRMTAMRYLKYPKEKLFHMVDQILAESREIENNRIYS
jgi:anthranilate 3-monooxygenase (FAD)/4-hydroxyphenylacetate 3-monooxygenase